MESLYHPVPQPDELTKRECEDAMGAYLMMFASIAAGLPLPIVNLLASVVYYFANKDKGRFVRFHALQSLWSQLPTSVINAGMIFWTIQIFFFENFEVNDYYWGYLIFFVVANILYFIFSIVGAVKARKGILYYFVFFGPLSFEQVYKIKPNEVEGYKPVNKSPFE
tara:strand:+ start:1345 stop:1842 length:498 start_codon:yes stop_codon:yes gene_type:complete